MTRRKSLTPARRLKIFEAHHGVCHLCTRAIAAGEAWDVSHDRPLGLDGADDESNMFPAHRTCHKVQTTTQDIPRIAKAKATKQKHLGIKRQTALSSPKLPKPPLTKSLPPRQLYEER